MKNQELVDAVLAMIERQRKFAKDHNLENRCVSYSESRAFAQLGDASMHGKVLNFGSWGQECLEVFIQPKNDICEVIGGWPGLLPKPKSRDSTFPFFRKTDLKRSEGAAVGYHTWGHFDGSRFQPGYPLEEMIYEICGDYLFISTDPSLEWREPVFAVVDCRTNLVLGSISQPKGSWNGSLVQSAQIWQQGFSRSFWVNLSRDGWSYYGR